MLFVRHTMIMYARSIRQQVRRWLREKCLVNGIILIESALEVYNLEAILFLE